MRDCDARQATAVTEGEISNAGYAIRNRDTSKDITALEGVLSDASNAIRDCDAR